jgi:hypothetical protein
MADESDEWKFSVDEVGDDADDGDENVESDGSGVTVLGGDDDGPTVKVGGSKTAAEELSSENGEGEGVAGPIALSTEVEAGTPTFENALFVALGVLLMLFVLVSLVVELDLAGTVGLAAAVALVAGALYEFFRRF